MEGVSYGMPALLYRGQGLAATDRAKSFLVLYPFSGNVVSAVLPELPGFDTTKGSIHYQAEQPIPEMVLRRIVAPRRGEIDTRAGA